MPATPVTSFDEVFDTFLDFLQSPSTDPAISRPLGLRVGTHLPPPSAETDAARDGPDAKSPDNTSIIDKDKDVQAKVFKEEHRDGEGEKYKTVEAIKRCLEEKMDLKKYGEDLSKSEFKEFLLDATGILANDALLDAIYSATDKDKSGSRFRRAGNLHSRHQTQHQESSDKLGILGMRVFPPAVFGALTPYLRHDFGFN